MVHELFHLDANSVHVSPSTGHVYDRKIEVYNQINGNIETKQAYGALYAKILANWTGKVGFYVATNGKSLAITVKENETDTPLQRTVLLCTS